MLVKDNHLLARNAGWRGFERCRIGGCAKERPGQSDRSRKADNL
jgi:hypothetical protein